jgi:hypothetical protein
MRPRLLLVACLLAGCGAIPAVAAADETVMVCDVYGNHVAPRPAGVRGIGTSGRCPGNAARAGYTRVHPPGGMAIWTLGNKVVRRGHGVNWTVNLPAGLHLMAVSIPHMYSQGLNDGNGWAGGFTWKGGSGGVTTFNGELNWSSHHTKTSRFTWPSGGSQYFGWHVKCAARHCKNGGHQWISVELLELRARESTRPHLLARGLWQQHAWVRGEWKLQLSGDSPSGLCALSAKLNGKSAGGSVSRRHSVEWHQCSAPPVDELLDTSRFGQGRLPLVITGKDAAGLTVTASRTIEVDNERPTISLAGPTEASTTDGTQYIRVAGAAGPSGVAGIACSLDNAPPRMYPSSNTAIAVRGVGVHHVVCRSENNARNAAGERGTSAPASWTLSIRAPSVSTLTFDRIGSALRCARQHRREQVPGRWSVQRRNGHTERVWTPPSTRTVTVVHCHLRVVHRTVRRNGRWVTTTTLKLPRHVSRGRMKVPFGRPTMVSGWLGTPEGTALGGQRVRVLTAVDNSSLHFTQASIVRTAGNGIWTARLPAGPSRVVVAVYPGARTLEPSYSAPAHLVVPAGVRLHITPRHTHWGNTIKISGVVRGGYTPAKGEIVFLHVGWKGGSAEIGNVYTNGNGRFSTTYTFLRGRGTETYRIWATTGRESDYPYAPGRSNRVRVTVRQ